MSDDEHWKKTYTNLARHEEKELKRLKRELKLAERRGNAKIAAWARQQINEVSSSMNDYWKKVAECEARIKLKKRKG